MFTAETASPSMFGSLGGTSIGPSPEDLRRQAEEASRTSNVIFKHYVTRTYNLSSEKDVTDYNTAMETIIEGVRRGTHTIFHKDKQFVADKAAWLINMEWGEFELQETLVQPVPAMR